MARSSIDDVTLADGLARVFSRYGYCGASIDRLSEETGLGRASLYHRFPGGKDEMVAAIITRAEQRYGRALAPAFAEGVPYERAQDVAKGLNEYYKNGTQSCLIIALSISDGDGPAAGGQCVEGWADGLMRIALDAGMSSAEADSAVMDAIAAIEGGLVIAATTGKTGAYERAIATLPERLTGGRDAG